MIYVLIPQWILVIIIFIIGVSGGWIVFDGIISLTYFAEYVDNTSHVLLDQLVRAIRTIIGLILVLLSVYLYVRI